jgi:hypothetical protein
MKIDLLAETKVVLCLHGATHTAEKEVPAGMAWPLNALVIEKIAQLTELVYCPTCPGHNWGASSSNL